MPSVPPKRRLRAPFSRLALLGALLVALPLGARAATFTVSSLGDDVNDPTTLRGAIAASEASTDASDTINITATGTIALAQANGTLFVNNGQNVAGKTLAIVGPGGANLAVDGGGQIGVFYFGDAGTGSISVSVSGITIQNGSNSNGGPGIFNTQTLTLTDVVLSGNTTTGNVGSLYTSNATVTLTNCDISGNTASSGSGGGLYVDGGAATLTNCTVNNNNADFGGGIQNSAGTLTMTGCTVSGNTVGTNSGGIENDGTATLTGCTISNNTGGYGGGIYNSVTLTLTGCTVSGNTSPYAGGGIENQPGADGDGMTVTDTTISGNTAVYGAGVNNDQENTTDGGALTSSFTRCTFSGNTASQEGGGIYDGNYDSSANGGAVSSAFTNCTFSGNSAGGDFGGGLYVDDEDATNNGTSVIGTILTNCTVSGNTAPSDGGGIDFFSYTANGSVLPTCTVTSSLIAGNTLTGGSPGSDPDYNLESSSLFTSGGSNLIGIGTAPSGLVSGTNHDQVGTTAAPIAPLLGALAANGGPVQTLALLAGSPALDADYNTGVTTDGRGLARPSNVRNDIGAFEHQQPAAAALAFTTTVGVAKTVSAAFLLASVTAPDATVIPTATLVTGPSHGTLTRNPDDSLTYTPDARFAGTDSVTYQVNDGVMDSAPATVTITVQDVTPPVTTAVLNPAQPSGANGYYNAAVQVTLTGTDDADGPLTTFYSVDGAPQQTYTTPLTVSPDGIHTVTFSSRDAAGNVEAPAKSVSFQIDATAPVTTATTQSTTTGEQVTLSATDNLSGLASTAYAVDGGAQTPYTGAFTVTGNGPHAVAFFSADKAGNVETTKTAAFTINIAAPVTTASVAGPQGTNGYYTGAATVTLTARSQSSTVTGTFYSVDGGAQTPYTAPFAVSDDAAHTVVFHSTDAAGNTEADNTLTVKIDGVAPVTTGSLAGPQNAGGVYTGAVTATLAATDDFSGVSATTYSLDGGAAQAYTAPFSVGTAGTHTVTFSSADKAGNAEATKTLTFTIQLTPPVAHTFPAGLQLFSVPADYSAVPLGSALSQSSPRLAVWSPSLVQYVLSPTAPADALRPGQGYWARFSAATSLFDLGTPTPTDKPFALTLQKGWNMIGDPFPGTVSLSGVTVQNGGQTYSGLDAASKAGVVAFTLYSYPAGANAYQTQSGSGTLTPYVGYWLYAFQGCTLQVSAP